MNIKQKYYLLLFLFIIGFSLGNFLYKIRYYCLSINFSHHPFYGAFAYNLQNALQKRGYFINCPDFLPHTVVSFAQTDYTNYFPEPKQKDFYTNILVNGDCNKNIDIEYFRKFDILLNLDEFQNGFLTTFNFRTAYFPLTSQKERFCYTDYENHHIDINHIAKQFDLLIQGVLHEKF